MTAVTPRWTPAIPDRPRWARVRWLWLFAAVGALAAVACLLHGWEVAYTVLISAAVLAYAWGFHR